MFEASSSKLQRYFVSGIKKYRDEINSHSDPVVRTKMTAQLCALAYSLPNGNSTEHSISECAQMMPASFPTPKQREKPDCTYMQYLDTALRTEAFGTGRTPALPTEAAPAKTTR